MVSSRAVEPGRGTSSDQTEPTGCGAPSGSPCAARDPDPSLRPGPRDRVPAPSPSLAAGVGGSLGPDPSLRSGPRVGVPASSAVPRDGPRGPDPSLLALLPGGVLAS